MIFFVLFYFLRLFSFSLFFYLTTIAVQRVSSHSKLIKKKKKSLPSKYLVTFSYMAWILIETKVYLFLDLIPNKCANYNL